MKILLIIVGIVAVLLALAVVAIVIIGYRLPAAHIASRSISLNRPPSAVYDKLRNFENAPAWRQDISKVEILGTIDGRVQFRENGSGDSVTYELLEDVPNTRLITRIVNQDLPYSGSWTYDLTSSGTVTTLTITENGEVTNPVFRFASRYILGHTATIDKYLSSLEKSFVEPG